VKVRLFIVLLVVASLFGYLTFRNKQIGDVRADIEFSAGVKAAVSTVMSDTAAIRIWRHGDRLAYEAGGGVGLVAPRGKGQRIYTASTGQFVGGSMSYILTRDAAGVHVHTRRGSFLLPNSADPNASFEHLWSSGLLYYTLSTGEDPQEAFLGLFAYNPETQTNKELMGAQEGYRATALVLSPVKTQLMLVLRPSLRPGTMTEPSKVWVYDLAMQKSARVEVLPFESDEPGGTILTGPLTWESDSTLAVGLRQTTDDTFAGTAVYNYTDGELRLKRMLPDKLTVVTAMQRGNLLVLTELVGGTQNCSFIESQVWLYDPATDQLTQLPDPLPGQRVKSAAYHETSGNVFLLRQTRPEGEETSLTMASFVEGSGRETPLFTVSGTITDAVWIGDTLYAVILKPEQRYNLNRIAFPRR